MVYINGNKKKVSDYDNRIALLHEELESVARQLSDISGKRDHVKSEIGALEKQKCDLTHQLVTLKEEMSELGKQHDVNKVRAKRILEDSNTYVESQNRSIVELNVKVEELLSYIRRLEKEIAVKMTMLNSIQAADEQLKKTFQERDRVMKQIQDAVNDLDKREQHVIFMEDELDHKIEKNGMILTKTEENLRELELYAKRLQAYYEETGLNIYILDKFNIKRDNVTP